MSDTHYIELYKKYRPKVWTDLIGQKKLAKSLQLAVLKNKVPTAYLLSGPRGTGKTSSSLLLAKAVNCSNLDDQANPCNECATCINIDNGTQLGVNYISMANRGSVDDIREIMKEAKIAQPVEKIVYILDEIQNCSRAAIDALLVPLEDSSMDALFIFATTEIQKIPQTLISRAQSRTLTLVAAAEMEEHVRHILELEEKSLTDTQISEVVKRGRGSVRDTMTALESALMGAGNDEDEEASIDYSSAIIEAISEQNLAKALAYVAGAVNDGNSGRDLAELMHSDTRDILLSVSGADEQLIGTIPVDDPQKIVKGMLGVNGLFVLAEEIGNAITSMSIGSDARVILEIAIIKTISKLKKLRKALIAQRGGGE